MDKFVVQNNVLIKYNGTDEIVNVPNSVTEMSIGVFDGCTSLKEVIIPNSVTMNKKVTQRTEKQAKSIAEKDRKIEEQEKEIKRLQGQVKAQEYIIEDFERIYEQEQEREY